MSLSPIYSNQINEYWILVTGGFSVGKTEFIRSISEYDEWDMSDYPKELGKWLSPHGRIDLDDHTTLCLYQPPPSLRFSTIFDISTNQHITNWIGTIFITSNYIDAEFSLPEANNIIQSTLMVLNIPYLVAVNLWDTAPSISSAGGRNSLLTFEQVVEQLEVETNIPILPCVAKDKASVQQVVLALMDEIIKSAL
ncbi:MAG: hypothetical protein RLP44_06315 [Aggregatilineales bacterium]